MSTPSKYWREIPQRYRLEANRCSGCNQKFFPPRRICPECGDQRLEPAKLAERGKLLTYTIVRVPPSQFKDQAPYAVGIVELEDGVKLTGQIVDTDFNGISIGMPLKIEFRRMYAVGDSGILCYGYKFVPEA
jgi:uncharacterized OB-fold protein